MFLFLLVLSAFILSSYAGIINAVDSTNAISHANYTLTLGQGYTRAIIRGYDSACSVGGQVNPNFVSSYKNARAAGYTDIQTYWLPCNGNGNKCKSYDIQLLELLETFVANQMEIGMIWVDFEQDVDCNNNWNYGTAGNIAQAQSVHTAIRASKFKFGIYSSQGEWSTLFGSTGFVLNASVPLWFSTFGISNNSNSDLTVTSPFGGWTTGMGQQFRQASGSALFDLSVFSS